jgi:histidyl-tRNA synthetase
MLRFRLIEGYFRGRCLKWGYQEIRTPTIEYLHLFTSAGTLTPSMLSKVYSFLDWDGWSGERVVLRPDGTIPVARLYIDGMEGEGLAKLFYVSNIFIFEETGEEIRERWQCGVELIGVGSPLTDVELVSLSLEIMKELSLEGVELRLSHAGLIKSLLVELGLNPEEQTNILDQILDGNGEALGRIKTERPDLENILLPLLNMKGKSSGFLRNLKALSVQSVPKVKQYLDDFISIVELLDALEYDYRIDIASGVGFEYYTGVIFQLFIGEEKIGGGGRYEALIPAMGGGDIPASGFALYLDRLMDLVKPKILAKPSAPRILVRGEGKDVLKEAFHVASRLREVGYVVQFNLGGQEPANLRWVLDVKSKASLFILQDKVKSTRIEAQTIDEVLQAIQS